MSVRAYVLIQTAPGKAGVALNGILKYKDKGVVEAYAVIGPYDIIATLEASDKNAVASLVEEKIQGVDGFVRSTTCFAVKV